MAGVDWQITPLGDCALVVHLGETAEEDAFDRVQACAQALARAAEAGQLPGATELVPALVTVTVYFDLLRTSLAEMRVHVAAMLDAPHDAESWAVRPNTVPTVVTIPVCYGGSFGSDLELVATHAGLTPHEVVEIHSGAIYRVQMLGFAPGFPYLGGMSPRIAAPRRATPRLAVAAGSVGIGGLQTGVYPLETPGGWQIIGRTPRALFRPWQDPPTLLRAGDRVRFEAISPEQFETWREEQP